MNHKRHRGFTLIEVLIYLAIVSGVMIAATTFAWNVIGGKTKSQATQEVEANGRFIMNHLTKEIRLAEAVNPSSTLDVNLALPQSAGDILSLSMQNGSDDPTIIDVSNGVVRLKESTRGPYALSSNQVVIKDLTFKNLSSADGKSLHLGINLIVEHLNPDQREEYTATSTLTTSVELRNRP